MANPEHLEILRKGVKEWNRWRKEHPEVRRPDLSEAVLTRVNLFGADLTGAVLTWANLCRLNLEGAELSEAELSRANLSGANLDTADLHGADMFGTNLSNARLSGANFDGVRLSWTTFADNDLSDVKGLETVRHVGPSYISIDTIYQSQGKIPEVFLRGAGVPENFLTFMRRLAKSQEPIQYPTCFISGFLKLRSGDRRFCDRLHADLQAKGVRCWYFPEDAKWGEAVWSEIDRGIRNYDKLVVVCSKQSLTSGPVLREIKRSLDREDDELRQTGKAKHILFPIALDRYLFDTWKHERKADVLDKVVGSFQGWNRSVIKYDAAFAKLLSSLQADEPKA